MSREQHENELPEDKRNWLQALDLGDGAEQSLGDALRKDRYMREICVSALSAMLLQRDGSVIQAWINGGASPLDVEALIAKLQQGAAAGTGAGGAGAGGLTPSGFLASSLPEATIVGTSGSSTSQVVHMFEPERLQEWTHVDPFSEAQGRLTVLEAILQHHANADSVYPTATRALPASTESVILDNNEMSAVSNFDAAVLTPLSMLAASLPLPDAKGASWKLKAPLSLLATGIDDANSLQPSTDTPLQDSSAGHDIRRQHKGPLEADFALVLDSTQPLPVIDGIGPAAAGEQPGREETSSGDERLAKRPHYMCAKRPHYICVGVAKCLRQLVDMTTVPMAPIDLLAAWWNEQHVHHKHARAAIAQVFTYLELSRACHAFVTCYMGTWLVCRSPKDPRTLYVTAPFLSRSRYNGTAAFGSAATVKGAMAWLQYEALKNASASLAPYPGGGPVAASSGGGNGGNTGGGGGSNNDDEDDKLPDNGGSANLDSSYRPPGTTSRSALGAHGEQQQQRETKPQAPSGLPTGPTLELHRRLCNGSAGLVVYGAVGGTPAVVKLLGPDDDGMDAFDAEVQAYDALQHLQGKVVPDMLAAGSVPSGVHYVAVRHLPGKPLSEVARPLPPGVAQAAVAALQQVHSACPGFLHGDVRLQNIMLLPLGSSGEPARCMVIDFGRACLDGTEQEQGREVKELERLLQYRWGGICRGIQSAVSCLNG